MQVRVAAVVKGVDVEFDISVSGEADLDGYSRRPEAFAKSIVEAVQVLAEQANSSKEE